MPWTIGYQAAPDPELLDDFMCIVGRALCIASCFEAKCSYILNVFKLTDAITDGASTDAVRALMRSLSKDNMLGKAIRGIAAASDVPAEQFRILDAARESRNFLAHHAAAIGPIHAATGEKLRASILALVPHVTNLARADNMASAWEYEISEKEPAPQLIRAAYENMVLNWVFGDHMSYVESEDGAGVAGDSGDRDE